MKILEAPFTSADLLEASKACIKDLHQQSPMKPTICLDCIKKMFDIKDPKPSPVVLLANSFDGLEIDHKEFLYLIQRLQTRVRK